MTELQSFHSHVWKRWGRDVETRSISSDPFKVFLGAGSGCGLSLDRDTHPQNEADNIPWTLSTQISPKLTQRAACPAFVSVLVVVLRSVLFRFSRYTFSLPNVCFKHSNCIWCQSCSNSQTLFLLVSG